LATGVICPCHVLAGLAGVVLGGPALSVAAQDGLHAVYVPSAVLAGVGLLGLGGTRNRRGQAHEGNPVERVQGG
jgi:hypothetical protein